MCIESYIFFWYVHVVLLCVWSTHKFIAFPTPHLLQYYINYTFHSHQNSGIKSKFTEHNVYYNSILTVPTVV